MDAAASASAAKRDATGDGVPTAAFLTARITTLSRILIRRLEDIFAAAIDEPSASSSATNPALPPTLSETSITQFQIDVNTSAIIRATEDLMMLTRSLKEIWLFGRLDTLDEGNTLAEDAEKRKKMDEDVKAVDDGFKRFLEKYGLQSESVTNA